MALSRIGYSFSATVFVVATLFGMLTTGYEAFADEFVVLAPAPCKKCQILSDEGNTCETPGKCTKPECGSCKCKANDDDPTGVSCKAA